MRIIDRGRQASIFGLLAKAIRWAFHEALPVFVAQEIQCLIVWPSSIIERKLCEAAATVHGSFELLDAQNSEKHENEQHKGHRIEERINRAYEG